MRQVWNGTNSSCADQEQQREHAERDHRLHATHSNLLEQHDALNDERAELEATLQALREQAAAVEAGALL